MSSFFSSGVLVSRSAQPATALFLLAGLIGAPMALAETGSRVAPEQDLAATPLATEISVPAPSSTETSIPETAAADIPEEVLRAELILGARSPIDGKPLSAAEYAALQAEWQTTPPQPPQVSRSIEKTVNLLKLRKFVKTFFPFAPIK